MNPPPVASSRERVLRCRTVAKGTDRPSTHLRDLPVFVVEDEFGLGPQTEATPSELLLALLGRCLTGRIQAQALSSNILVHGLVLEVAARLAMSPAWGGETHEPEPAGFAHIEIKVHVDTPTSADAMRDLLSHAVLWSPVANTLHAPVHLDISLATPASA